MSSTNTQDALDEISQNLNEVSTNVATNETNIEANTTAITELNNALSNIGTTSDKEPFGGSILEGEYTNTGGIILENNATYICTISVDGTANKDGSFYMAVIAASGSFDFIGSDGAVFREVTSGKSIATTTHAIFKTGSSGTQKMTIYTNSSVRFPDLTFRMGAVRIA